MMVWSLFILYSCIGWSIWWSYMSTGSRRCNPEDPGKEEHTNGENICFLFAMHVKCMHTLWNLKCSCKHLFQSLMPWRRTWFQSTISLDPLIFWLPSELSRSTHIFATSGIKCTILILLMITQFIYTTILVLMLCALRFLARSSTRHLRPGKRWEPSLSLKIKLGSTLGCFIYSCLWLNSANNCWCQHLVAAIGGRSLYISCMRAASIFCIFQKLGRLN